MDRIVTKNFSVCRGNILTFFYSNVGAADTSMKRTRARQDRENSPWNARRARNLARTCWTAGTLLAKMNRELSSYFHVVYSLTTVLSWLYGMSLAVDANFRLKLKDRGVVDPELGPGWSYFVNDEKYKAEIIKHPQPIEVHIVMASLLIKLMFYYLRKATVLPPIKRLNAQPQS